MGGPVCEKGSPSKEGSRAAKQQGIPTREGIPTRKEIPTLEVVFHIRQEQRPQVLPLLYGAQRVQPVYLKAPPGGLRSRAERDEAWGFGGLPPF